jgi:hypothetical protein
MILLQHEINRLGAVAAQITIREGDGMSAGQRASQRLLLVASFITFVGGCGSGEEGGGLPALPVISTQPSSQSVPLGMAASFSVVATGTGVQYQWLKGSAGISGATGKSYTTPPASSADSGSTYSVIVSNSAGSVFSTAAALTVTARAPIAGDLRFQQVDSASTLNGWGTISAISSVQPGVGAANYSPAIGTPLYLSSTDCVSPPLNDGTGCSWSYSVYAVSPPGPTTAYGGDLYSNLESDLQPGSTSALSFHDSDITPASASAVINSLDIEPESNLFGLSWFQSAEQSGFVLIQNTLAPTALTAAAASEGAAGRVITAISGNGAQVTYFAYAWQSDTASVYEAQIITKPISGAAAAAANLASQGYIITATGLAPGGGSVFLVGTRIQGDTIARPFQIGNSANRSMLQQQGYAIVGVVFNAASSDPYTYLFER